MNIAKRYELVPLARIVPYARNARTHSKEQVAQIRASFREFGVLSPCLVDEQYNLLVGHGRLKAENCLQRYRDAGFQENKGFQFQTLARSQPPARQVPGLFQTRSLCDHPCQAKTLRFLPVVGGKPAGEALD